MQIVMERTISALCCIRTATGAQCSSMATDVSHTHYTPAGHGGVPSSSPQGVDVAVFRRHWEELLCWNKVPDPHLSVRWILEHVTQRSVAKNAGSCTPVWRMTEAEVTVATEMLTQRLKRKPVQYIIGEWDFREVTLSMRPPTFVPTPETEELVGHVIQDQRSPCAESAISSTPLKLLDLCCGSGAVAVSLLWEWPQVEVVAVDIAEEAVQLTKENAERNEVSERLCVLNMSVMDASRHFQREGLKFDCIVSNPPYLTSAELENLEPEIHEFMDRRALYGGQEGTDVAVEILSTCRHYLQPHGNVWLELGHLHLPHVQSLVNANPHWGLHHHAHQHDFNNKWRFHHLKLK